MSKDKFIYEWCAKFLQQTKNNLVWLQTYRAQGLVAKNNGSHPNRCQSSKKHGPHNGKKIKSEDDNV